MKRQQIMRTAVALAVAAAAFLLLALVLRWPLAFCAALGIGLYFALWFLLAPPADSRAARLERRPDGEDLENLLREADRDLKDVRRYAARITNLSVRDQALALADVGGKILAYLRENPDKIPSARRLLTYYLDITGKILDQYLQFQQSGLHTGEVRDFQAKVNRLLPKLRAEFEQQFSRLMADERFDVEADMEVIETMLQSEGMQ